MKRKESSPTEPDAMPDLRTGVREIGGVATRMIEVDGSGPVLVLLHGHTDHAVTWVPLMRELAVLGRRAVALDLPGCGQSGPLEPGAVLPQLDAFVAAAAALYREDGLPPVLVGNSMGGSLAIRAGADPAVSVSAIVPISPGGYRHARWIRVVERTPRLMALVNRTVPPMVIYRPMTRIAFRVLASGRGVMVDDAARAYSSQYRRRRDVRRLFGQSSTILSELRESARSTRPSAPMLLIWGKRDHLTLHSGAERLLKQATDPDLAELVTLPGCGHCPQLERPDLVAAVLDEYVQRLGAKPSALGFTPRWGRRAGA